jgi:hypothetical protein
MKQRRTCKPVELDENGTLMPRTTINPLTGERRKYIKRGRLEDKCWYCFSNYKNCDGTPPFLEGKDKCSTCRKRGLTCKSRQRHEDEVTKPKCKTCISNKWGCDRGTRCDTWVENKGWRYSYTTSDGIRKTSIMLNPMVEKPDRYNEDDMRCGPPTNKMQCFCMLLISK